MDVYVQASNYWMIMMPLYNNKTKPTHKNQKAKKS